MEGGNWCAGSLDEPCQAGSEGEALPTYAPAIPP